MNDQFTEFRNQLVSLQSAVEAIREPFKRSLRYLEEVVYRERELRDFAELNASLLEDKVCFVDDNARAIIRGLQRRIAILECSRNPGDECLIKPASSSSSSPLSSVSVAPDLCFSSKQPACDLGADTEIIKLRSLLPLREKQLERIAEQLNDVNNDFMDLITVVNPSSVWWQQQQTKLVETADVLERVRTRCIELQVELSREKRLTKDLETRLWQTEKASAFKHQLTASSVPVLLPFPNRYPNSRSGGSSSSRGGTSTHGEYKNTTQPLVLVLPPACPNDPHIRYLLPTHEFLAEFRAELLTMIETLQHLHAHHPQPSITNNEHTRLRSTLPDDTGNHTSNSPSSDLVTLHGNTTTI